MSDPIFTLKPLPAIEPVPTASGLGRIKPVAPLTHAAMAAGAPSPAPPPTTAAADAADALGPLKDLPGTWTGSGFNVIWRPFSQPGQDRFLELNLTTERIEFSESIGDIPNRGLLQGDIVMNGLTYLQKVGDINMKAGLHVEPGIWAVVPPTTNPLEPQTVVRMASIPHGTTLLAQGIAAEIAGPPVIADNDIVPFAIGNPVAKITFPEPNLAVPSAFRSEPAQLVGITQGMVDNPNSVLQDALAGQTITKTVALVVSSDPSAPVLGGGTANTAFLQGSTGAGGGPNAVTVVASSTFWIETVQGTLGRPDFLQLQYTQTVLLNFNGLSWPHVSVATLTKQP